MSTLQWYPVYNLADFIEEDIASKEIELNLEGLGVKDIILFRGVNYSILYEGIFLTIGLNDKSPYIFENHAVLLDDDDQIWLGLLED